MTFPAKFPQLNETQLTEHARTVLIRVIRVAFPHSRIPDGPYERTADIILKEAQASTWFRVALTQGLNSLDGLAGGDFCALDDDNAYRVLKGIEGTDFFGFVRRTTVLNLYDDIVTRHRLETLFGTLAASLTADTGALAADAVTAELRVAGIAC